MRGEILLKNRCSIAWALLLLATIAHPLSVRAESILKPPTGAVRLGFIQMMAGGEIAGSVQAELYPLEKCKELIRYAADRQEQDGVVYFCAPTGEASDDTWFDIPVVVSD